jgi:tRNA nucleotidyltransferase (CCA-adding enzyme)
MELFEVGGCVRDEILGLKSKDIDFTVVLGDFDKAQAEERGVPPFSLMVLRLQRMGFEIFLETPQFLTVRARFPKGQHKNAGLTADFVLARKDGGYSDGRRPDEVVPGTLEDDLARRDFTMNAIAKDSQGNLIDPFNGQADIERRTIRAVGNARTRIIEEDALRGMRALRFAVTKGFVIDSEVTEVIVSSEFRTALRNVAIERIQDELNKMFRHNTVQSIQFIEDARLTRTLFNDTGLRLMPTMKE